MIIIQKRLVNVCIYILFNDTVRSSECIILNDLVISEHWIWKVLEWSWLGL